MADKAAAAKAKMQKAGQKMAEKYERFRERSRSPKRDRHEEGHEGGGHSSSKAPMVNVGAMQSAYANRHNQQTVPRFQFQGHDIRL